MFCYNMVGTRHAVSLHCFCPAFSFRFFYLSAFRLPFLHVQFPHVHVGEILAKFVVEVLACTI